MTKATDKLDTARKHLDRAQTAADDPINWDDLSLYGFYCLEAAVEAAARYSGLGSTKKHWEKEELAEELHRLKGLPDVSDLLGDLNDARKAVAYGDVDRPEDLDPAGIASKLENYVAAVEAFMKR